MTANRSLIPVLYVHRRSNYKKLPFFDAYDDKRDARTYTGTQPAIFHPPCRTLSRIRGLSKACVTEKQLAYNSIDYVRQYGGIVEHPADSKLWVDKQVVRPGIMDEYGGFTICIDQSWFGFYTKKRTLLYIVGIQARHLPAYPLSLDATFRKFNNLTKKQASETTPELCIYLKSIIDKITENRLASSALLSVKNTP